MASFYYGLVKKSYNWFDWYEFVGSLTAVTLLSTLSSCLSYYEWKLKKMTLDPPPSCIQVIFCCFTPLYRYQIFKKACILSFVTPSSQSVAAAMLLGNTRPRQPGPRHLCPYSRGRQRPTSAAQEEPTQMKPNPAVHLQFCWAGKLAGPLLIRSSGCFSHVI